MALTSEFYTTVLVFGGTFATALLFARWRSASKSRGRYPPALPSVPFLGSMPFLPGFATFHIYLTEQSKILGKVMSINLFDRFTVTLNGREAIHEALVKHSLAFADRPTFFLDTIFNNDRKGIVEHPFNPHFKKYQHQSLTILKKFGFGQGIMEKRIQREVEELLNGINELNGEAFDPVNLVASSVMNVIVSIIFGKRFQQTDPKLEKMIILVRRMIREAIDPIAINVVPCLRFLPRFKKILQKSHALDDAMFEILQERVELSLSGDTEESFISCFVEEEGPEYDRKQLLYTLRDLFLAGSETTSTTLLWFLFYMANHPEIQKRLQKQIDEVVPRSRLPSLNDKSRLTYVDATTMEVMRIKTILPMALPHQTLYDCEIAGFFIPANSLIMPNIYSVHMDPELWSDPDKFSPDRFIDGSGSIVNKEYVIPFSLGRRSCLGEVLARQELFLFITGILQQYDILPPENQERVEVKEVVGVTISPSPYQVRLVKRH